MEQQWKVQIKPQSGWFDIDLKGLLKYKDLIKLFVRRTFVAKYKQTILGPAWAIIQPFFTTIVYSVFFGNIAGLGAQGVPNFIFYLAGTIMWGLFSGCLQDSANTFIGNSGILGKVYFPRLVMPIASTISQFISFFIQFAFLIIFLVYYCFTDSGVVPNLYILITPILLAQMAMLGLGFGTIISALTTKYRDITMLVSFGISLWSYSSPVAYDMFSRGGIAPGERFYNIYMLNPITPIINMFRYAYLGIGEIDWLFYAISWISTVIFLLLGILLFSRVEKTFMDTV